MRILHVTPSLARSHGGVSAAIRGLANAQQKAGHSVVVYTGYGKDDRLESPGIFDEVIVRDDARVKQFPVSKNPFWRRIESCPSLAKALRRDVEATELVHIHSMWTWCVEQAAAVCRDLGKPYVVSVHGGLDPWLLRKKGFVRRWYFGRFEKPRLEFARAVHFTAQQEMDLSQPLGLKIRPVVVPLGVDDVFFEAEHTQADSRKAFGLPPDAFIALQIGRIHSVKAIDVLLDAWARMDRSGKRLLWIVGPGEPAYVEVLRSRARLLSIENSVRFDGALYEESRVAAFFAADVVSLCSHKENFGLTAAEAMACGVPVIVSDKVNLASDVAQSAGGLVCGVGAGQIAGRLGELGRMSQVQRIHMGRAGQVWAEKNFQWGPIAEKMDAVYREALSGVSL